jgi:protein AroM
MPGVVGLITIGQSPRPDLEEPYRRHCPDADLRLVGALDGLTHGQVRDAVANAPAHYPLHTRLADGHTLDVPMPVLLPRIQASAELLVEQGAQVIVVLCAGGLPSPHASVPVIVPGQLMPRMVQVISPSPRVGVITPVVGQVPYALDKWRRDGFTPVVRAVAPTGSRTRVRAQLRASVAEFAADAVEVVVLDCFGFTVQDARDAQPDTPVVILTADDTTARTTGAILAAMPARAARPPASHRSRPAAEGAERAGDVSHHTNDRSQPA